MPSCPFRSPSVLGKRGRAIIRQGPGPSALRERPPGEQTWRRSPARSGPIQTRRPDGVKAARELRNPLDTGTAESYPGPPQAGGSRAHGHDDNDDQAYDRRLGLAGHHPGRDRLAAGSQVIEVGRRERRTGGKGRARERRSGPGSLSLSAAGILRIGGLRQPAVVSGSRFRPPDSVPISRLTAPETAILVPVSAVSPPDCPRTERESRLAGRFRRRAETYARRLGPGLVRNVAPAGELTRPGACGYLARPAGPGRVEPPCPHRSTTGLPAPGPKRAHSRMNEIPANADLRDFVPVGSPPGHPRSRGEQRSVNPRRSRPCGSR